MSLGLRLPGSSGDGSYYDLVQKYANGLIGYGTLTQGDTGLLSSPLAFLRSGNYLYSNGGLDHRTTVGYYWSDRYYSIARSYYLLFYSTYLNPQDSYPRGGGFSLRCLAR